MERNFSLYLIRIGLVDESSIKPILKSSNKSSVKNFTNTSFNFLMNYFDNLTEEQKKYMSFYVPAKYMLNMEEVKRNKLKTIFIQLKLRQNITKLKYLYLWKRNIKLFKSVFNNRYIQYNSKNNKILFNKNINKEAIYQKILKSKKHLSYKKIVDNDNKKINKDFAVNKDEYEIENVKDNKKILNFKNLDIDPINQLHQISQNTISLDDIFSKNPNNNENIRYDKNYNKNSDHISNIKNINNFNPKNIKSYKFKNNEIINQIKSKQSYKNSNIITYKDFRSKSKESNKKSKSNANSNKKPNLKTSLEEKEMEELKECTFKPKINNGRTKRKRNILSGGKTFSNFLSKKEIQATFEKLYNDSEKYKISREMKTIDHEYLLGKNISFTPNISNNLNFRKSYITKSDKNFEERQKEYLFKKNRKCEELKNKLNENYEKLCSFNPKITNDKGEYYQTKIDKKTTLNVFRRLYEDSKIRKDSQEQKELENINKFNDLANTLSQNKVINYELFDKLKENNEKEELINRIREKIDEEKGITFKPNIEENEYLKNVDGTFFERNENWINKKNNFIEEELMKQNEDIKKKSSKREYTKEEKEEIIDNIINRLYYKNMSDKSKEELKEEES